MSRKLLLCAMALSVMSAPILASNGNNKIVLSKREENTLACVKNQILNSESVDKEFNNFTLNDWKQRPKQNRFVVQKTLEKLHKNECADINEALNRSVDELKTKIEEKSDVGYFGIVDEDKVKSDSYAIISGYRLDVAVLGKKVTVISDSNYSLSSRDIRTKGVSSDFANKGYRYSKTNPTTRKWDSIQKGKYNVANNPKNYGRFYDSKYKSTLAKNDKDINRNKYNSQLSMEAQSIYKNKKDNPFNNVLVNGTSYQSEHGYSKDTQSFKGIGENISHSDRFSRADITNNSNYNQSKENVTDQEKYSKDNQSLGNKRARFLYSDKVSKSSEISNIDDNQSKYSSRSDVRYDYENDKKSNEELNEQLKIINDDLDNASMKEGWSRENK